MFRSTPELYFRVSSLHRAETSLETSEGFQPNKTVTSYSEPESSDLQTGSILRGDNGRNQKDGMELVSETGSIKTAVQRKGGKHCDCRTAAELEILLDGQPLDHQPYSGE